MANLLRNGYFEFGHGPQDGVPELVMPHGWRLHFLDGVPFPGIGDPGAVAGRPESVVWHIDNAPPHEQPLFFLRGTYCLKVFKSHMPVYFAFSQQVSNLQPGGLYRLRVPVYPDLVMDYQNGQKVFADDDRSGGLRLGYSQPGAPWPAGLEGSVVWGDWHEMRYGNLNFGAYNTLEMELPAGAEGELTIWIEAKAIWALRNNGFFFDDFRLLGPVGPAVIGPPVQMSAAPVGYGAYQVRLTAPEGLAYVELEAPGATVGPVTVEQGGLGYEWIYPLALPEPGTYPLVFYAHNISPRVFELEYGLPEPPEVSLAAEQLLDNHFRIVASCAQALTDPQLQLPGAVVGEVQVFQPGDDWAWHWAVRLPQGVAGRYTALFSAQEVDDKTVSFDYQPPPASSRGAPREQYVRRAFIYHHSLDFERFAALAAFCYQRGYTLMSSADDGGIGDLDQRIVVVVSPGSWGDWPDPETGELQHGLNARWYQLYYPGVQYFSVEGEDEEGLEAALRALALP